MSQPPFFSVILPTLNGAKYISFAIQSVLNQTFEDFELIVSDNSSIDNTETIVKRFTDSRVKYFKTEKTVPMYESWEFALNHSKGEYITFLGDDDAHSKIYLETQEKIISENRAQIVACRMADYFYQDSEYYKAESLVTPPFNNRLYIYDSRQVIDHMFTEYNLAKGNFIEKIQLPQLINTVYHKSVFSEIRNKFGKVFPSVLSTDFYLAVIALSVTKKYFYIDSPLSFHGISASSTTSSISNNETTGSIKNTQPELAVFKKVPLSIYVPYNFIVDALLLAKTDLGSYLNDIDIDLTGYFINIFYYIHGFELRKQNISDKIEEFYYTVKKQDLITQNKVFAVTLNKTALLKNKLRKKLNENPIYRILRKIKRMYSNKMLAFEGKYNGFEDITGCAKFVDKRFLSKYES